MGAVNDEFPGAADFRATSGEDAAQGSGADEGAVVVVAAQQASEFEVEDVVGLGEGDVILEGTRDAQHGGGGGVRRAVD